MSKMIIENQSKEIEKLAWDQTKKQDRLERRLRNVEQAKQQERLLIKERNRLNVEDL